MRGPARRGGFIYAKTLSLFSPLIGETPTVSRTSYSGIIECSGVVHMNHGAERSRASFNKKCWSTWGLNSSDMMYSLTKLAKFLGMFSTHAARWPVKVKSSDILKNSDRMSFGGYCFKQS